MRFNILCDASWEAKVDKVLESLSNLGYRRYFEEKSYGESLEGIIIDLICQDPELKLKQRVRLSKKDKTLYLDLMLDLQQFLQINQAQRNKIVADKIINEVPSILSKYKLNNFELKKFENDLKKVFEKIE